MKRIFFLLLAIAAVFVLQWSQSSSAINQSGGLSREFKKTVDFQSGGDFTLNTDKGSVRLVSWDQNQVEIHARIVAPQRVDEDYGRRAIEGARVDVTGDARSLTVRSNFDDVPDKEGLFNSSKALPDIHYEIRAPRNLNLSLNADRCKVEVRGFQGKIKLETDRTPVEAGDLAGDIRIRMDRGEARLSNLRGSLDIESDRTNGELKALRIEGDSRLEIDRGEYELGLSDSQRLTIRTDNSRRAGFESDFSVAKKIFDDRNFEGTINGGGPRLSIRTDRGKVSLRRE